MEKSIHPTTAVLVTARLGSKRLPEKHLQDVDGTPILEILLRRIEWEFRREIENGEVRVVICTTDEGRSEPLRDFTRGNQRVFFAGSVHNIPLRHRQCGESLGIEQLVTVDGDDILCSPKGMRSIYAALKGGALHAKTALLPFGMNVSGYRTSVLRQVLGDHPAEVMETGWGRIFDGIASQEIPLPTALPTQSNEADFRLTLDYAEDLAFFRKTLQTLGDHVLTASDEDVLRAAFQSGAVHLNSAKNAEYWANFYRQVAEEKAKA